MASADVPSEWKLANVTPIFKTGNKSSPSNYRPVSLTVVLCKIFESILRDKMCLQCFEAAGWAAGRASGL